AAVGRLEQPAAETARGHFPGVAIRLPQSRVHDLRVVRIEHELDRAGLVVAEENFFPRLAAIFRSEYAALGIRRRMMAECGDVDEIRIRWMHADLRNDLRFREADVRPRLPGIRGLVCAVALDDVAANFRLAGADVNDIGIGWRHRGRADRGAV